MISSTMLKIRYNMFRTAYYRLILLPTFESADMVAKVKQKIGSEMELRLRSGNFFSGLCGIPPSCLDSVPLTRTETSRMLSLHR